MLSKILWAKTNRGYGENVNIGENEWLSLYQHSVDTLYASEYVWDRFIDGYTKKFLSTELNKM